MTEQSKYMTDPEGPPDETRVAEWVGQSAFRFWKRMAGLIEETWPGVFVPEWLYGGRKHGWSLRYKKSRSFCTFVPEKGRFSILITFGAEQRAGVETTRGDLSQETRSGYDQAPVFTDGKWFLMAIDSDRAVEDAARLLSVKRKPGHARRS
ncbi:MAG: DUF3788 domain-containing protein [Candidatus Fermentibacter sp.]|nr:DUF3788 domain-containing protein [Candidatus Fermentibacter sp.]